MASVLATSAKSHAKDCQVGEGAPIQDCVSALTAQPQLLSKPPHYKTEQVALGTLVHCTVGQQALGCIAWHDVSGAGLSAACVLQGGLKMVGITEHIGAIMLVLTLLCRASKKACINLIAQSLVTIHDMS